MTKFFHSHQTWEYISQKPVNKNFGIHLWIFFFGFKKKKDKNQTNKIKKDKMED